MILLNIFDVKNTMLHLLVKNSFDGWLLEDACVTTFATMKIEGKRNGNWYDEPETRKTLPRLLYWQEVKNIVFEYIKGKRTPDSFQITLKITTEEGKKIFSSETLISMMEKYQGELLLHFRFEQERLMVVTGISYNSFTMDKELDFAWDDTAKKLFTYLHIGYEEE